MKTTIAILFLCALCAQADVTISVTLTDYQFSGVQHAAGTNNPTTYFQSRCKEVADSYAAQKAAAEKSAIDAKYELLSAQDKAEVDALISEKAPK